MSFLAWRGEQEACQTKWGVQLDYRCSCSRTLPLSSLLYCAHCHKLVCDDCCKQELHTHFCPSWYKATPPSVVGDCRGIFVQKSPTIARFRQSFSQLFFPISMECFIAEATELRNRCETCVACPICPPSLQTLGVVQNAATHQVHLLCEACGVLLACV